MHNACASYFANSSRYRMQPVGPCLWRKDLSWEFGSKQRQVQTLGTHRCPPKDREKDTIREAKAKTGQGFKALVCFLKYVFRFWITFGKKTSCLLPSLLCFKTSNGLGQRRAKIEQRSGLHNSVKSVLFISSGRTHLIVGVLCLTQGNGSVALH